MGCLLFLVLQYVEVNQVEVLAQQAVFFHWYWSDFLPYSDIKKSHNLSSYLTLDDYSYSVGSGTFFGGDFPNVCCISFCYFLSQ
jgi:hypothetical protein